MPAPKIALPRSYSVKSISITSRLVAVAIAIAVVPCIRTVSGQDCDALVNVLVQKKILTAREADKIRADLVRENSDSGKVKLGSSVKELTLYGDLRMRYEYYRLDPQFDPFAKNNDPHTNQSTRFRFRLRVGADFQLTDNWFGGVQLVTAKTPDTGSQSFDGAFPNYDIYISRAYVGWKSSDGALTVVAGKQPNPLYATDMVWDPNINPDGFSEQVKLHKLFPADTGKDAPASPWEFTLTAGQFCYADNLESAPSHMNTDAWLFEEQAMLSYRFDKNTKLTVAPAYLWWTSAQVNTAYDIDAFSKLNDGLPLGVDETADLSIVEVPGDLAFKLGGLSTKFFWDFSYNTKGAKRDRDIYQLNGKLQTVTKDGESATFASSTHTTKDDFGWQIGFLFGQNARAGDLSFFASYREVGIASVDPNINCSDYGLSRLNVKGPKLSLAYNVTDFSVFQVTWFLANNLRKDLKGGQATGGSGIADANSVQLICVDLVTKF